MADSEEKGRTISEQELEEIRKIRQNPHYLAGTKLLERDGFYGYILPYLIGNKKKSF